LIMNSEWRARREDCVLLVIDVQDRLIDTIVQNKELIRNIRALIKTAIALDVSILATEQEKLGGTVSELEQVLSGVPKVRKLAFSGCGVPEFVSNLKKSEKKTVVACGTEAHVCVLQTTLDLIQSGYKVVIPVDAISSHAAQDRDTAIRRMIEAGAVASTTETLIYEWLEKAGTDEFRKVLEIVKERRGVNA